MSQPSTRSASPAAMRTACSSAGFLPMRMCVVTAPPFCARPVWSSTEVPLPSKWAAIPSNAPMVTTPVPPTPVSRMFHGCSRLERTFGIGRALKSILAFGFFLRSGASTTETKLGQKPRTQLKSLLQPLWSISRLRPNSVSFGSTETQADFTEQSPQPSQTSELMTTRFGGSTISLRLRRRRFSAAQVWS